MILPFRLVALGFAIQVASAEHVARDAAEYRTTEISSWAVPTLVPCPPIQWVNTKPTPVTQSRVVTQTVPDKTTYTTSIITKEIPSYTTIFEKETYYTETTITKYTTYVKWTTSTSLTVDTSYTTQTSRTATTETSTTTDVSRSTDFITSTSIDVSHSVDLETSTTTHVRQSIDLTTSTTIDVSQSLAFLTSTTTDVLTDTSSTTLFYETTDVFNSTSVLFSTDVLSATLTFETVNTNFIDSTTILSLTDISSSTVTYETTNTAVVESTSTQLAIFSSTETFDLVVTNTITSTRVETSTSTASLPECSSVGPFASLNSDVCDSDSCLVEYELGAFLEWTQGPVTTPVLTELVFINPTARLTCVTTSCNTEAFDRYYKTTATDCPFPPCPSNTVDCDCNFVVGPIRLPNGKTTSVTQTGPTGASLILGPSAVARAIPTNDACGFAGCLTSASTILFTELGYSGTVNSSTLGGSQGSPVTNYFLPQLTNYFPTDNPLRSCTTVSLALYTADARPVLAKREAVAAPVQLRFPGAPDSVGRETQLPYSQVDTTTSTADGDGLPSVTAPPNTATVTVTPIAPSSTSTPDQPSRTDGTEDPSISASNDAPPAGTVSVSLSEGPSAETGSSLGLTAVTQGPSVFAGNGSVILPSTWNYICSAEGCTLASASNAANSAESEESSSSDTSSADPVQATTNDALASATPGTLMIILASVAALVAML